MDRLHFNRRWPLVWTFVFLLANYTFSLGQETNTPLTLGSSEMRVNTTTENSQQSPAVAMDSLDNYVVAWESLGTDGSGFGIYSQRYNSDDTPNGSEFLVNTTTAGNQRFPVVAMDKAGNFVVAWMDALKDGSGWGIYAQRYDNTGATSGAEFIVNSETTGHQRNPRVAMRQDGAFVIVWMQVALDGASFAIEGRLFDNTGTAAGNDFQINTTTGSFHGYPDVDMNIHGNFAVVWQSLGTDGSGQGIYAQRFDSTGVMLDSEFQVNTTTDDNQQSPRVAMDSTGNFVVTWTSFEQDGDAGGIYAQRFNSDGSTNGDEFHVSSTTEGSQDNADVTSTLTGEFVIAWNSYGQDSSFHGVYLKAFDNTADSVGSEIQVNMRTDDFQQFPALAQYHTTNDLLITWQDGLRNSTETHDGDGYGIFLRRTGIVFSNLPLADAGADTAICVGASVQIGGNPTASSGMAPYTYSWEPATGLDDATIANPSASPVVTTTYTVTVIDANSDTVQASVEVTVHPLPTVTFSPVASQCIDSDAVDLSEFVSPAGGTFSGLGISDNSFDPAMAGVGTHTIIYSYTDGNSCVNSDSVGIVVNDLPAVSFDPIDPQCVDSDAINLTGFVSPVGGSFSGTGISGNSFDPAVAGVGTHTITYTYTDGNSCENSASVDIVVNDLPTVTFDPVDPQCMDSDAVDLSGLVSPSGGIFSGPGISDSSFDPAAAGAGIHTIIYAFTDGNSCENSDSVDIVVNDLPIVTFDPVSMLFVGDDPVDLSGLVSPFGGSFSGAGISGNTFDPTIAGVGTHTITYAYTDGNACENTASIDIEVAAVQLSVLHLNADGQPYNNVIKPYLKFDNEGDYQVSYDKITLRYWLTVEDFSPMANLSVYWAQLGASNVNMSYVALAEPHQGAVGYVEYSFDASAGELEAGSNSGPIQNGIAKQNWTNFDETDDYSYATATTYTPNEQITAYYNGYLVWGTEPGVVPAVQSIKVYSETKNPTKSNTIGTYVQVRNEGNVAVSFQDLTVRYWFTADGEAAMNFYLDYAVLGNANINGQIVQLPTPLAGADRYLELSFAASLGSLNPGSNTGNIQYRMAKADWSKFDQGDDHSYVPKGAMSENVNMTVYLDGELIYGTEPAGANARVLSETASKTSDATLVFYEQGTLDGDLQWKVYPNPTQDWIHVEYVSREAGTEKVHLLLYDLSGVFILEQEMDTQAAQPFPLDLSLLSSGVYLLQVRAGEVQKTMRIVKE